MTRSIRMVSMMAPTGLLAVLVFGLVGCEKDQRRLPVMLAATDLEPGDVIAKYDIVPRLMTMEQVTARGIAPQYTMLRLEDVVDRVVRAPIQRGDPFVSENLYPGNPPGLTLHYVLIARSKEKAELLTEALSRLAKAARQETGCLNFEVYHSANDARHFIVFQRWRRPDDFSAHQLGRNFKEILSEEFTKDVLRGNSVHVDERARR